jgi:hypothetical protein
MTHPGQVSAEAETPPDGAEVAHLDPAAELAGRLGIAAQRLAGLADQPLTEHLACYDALHGELQDALAVIDSL